MRAMRALLVAVAWRSFTALLLCSIAVPQVAAAQSPHTYLAGDPSGQVVALFKPLPDSERALYGVVGSANGFGAPQVLSFQRRPGFDQGFSLAGNAHGDAIATWVEPRPRRTDGP